jgi:DNA-binding transcriptional ArsR family regulator
MGDPSHENDVLAPRCLTQHAAALYLTMKLSKGKGSSVMSPDHLSATFAALADPTRRSILARLASGEATVTEIAAPFEMSMPAVSKHLKVLERAGLIARGREAQWRPCRLEAAPLKEVADWVELYREMWEQRLDRLDDFLRELQAKEKKEKVRGRKRRGRRVAKAQV